MTKQRTFSLSLIILLGAITLLNAQTHEKDSDQQSELKPARLGTITQLHRHGEIFLASQPSAEDFALARESGIQTVIDLRRESELPSFNEKQIVKSQGLTYLHLPFGGAKELTDSVFETARKYLKTAELPILLHCSSANRVGAVWIPYRVLDGGISYEEALAEARTIGLRTAALEEKARKYIQSRR